MPNIYDVNAAIDKPNIMQSFQQGQILGERQRVARKQEADLSTLRNLAPQIIAGNQQAFDQAAAINPQAAQQFQAIPQAREVDHAKKLGNAARYMAQALRTKNPTQIQGAWQNVRPYIAQLSGKEPPQQWDPAMEPALFQAIAATGGMPDVKGIVVAPGSVLANPSTGESMLRNPASLQYQNVPMGEGKAAGAFDPATGTVRPAVGGGAAVMPPSADPMRPFIDQANAAIQMGAPQAQVEAWLTQQAQNLPGAQVQPGGASVAQGQPQGAPPTVSAQFGIGTPKPAAGTQETWNQPVDEAGPDGNPIRVQYSNRGGRRVVEGAVPVTKPADAKRQAQARQAKVSLQGTVAQLDRLEQAAAQLKADPGLPGITGLRGHIPDIPGSDAARARAQLETLGSQAAFGVLQQMREMSKTGGALGQVSDRENEMLRNNLAALGTNQSAEDFQKALDQIIAYARDSKARMQGAFTDTYGNVESDPATTAAPAPGVWSIERVL